MKKLASKSFWEKYWTKKIAVKKIGRSHYFRSLFDDYLSNMNGKSVVEVGGYPGIYAVYLNKYYGLKPTIIDYIQDKKLLLKIMEVNDIKRSEVETVRADFLTYKNNKKFDVVVSFGFVEHFDDTKKIIQKHATLCKKNGKIIIAIPNFLGLNGFIQKKFDPKNLSAHNLKSMDKLYLESIMKKMQVEKFAVNYYGGLLIWLENITERSIFLQTVFLTVNLFGLFIKTLGLNSRWTSPYIVITAQK